MKLIIILSALVISVIASSVWTVPVLYNEQQQYATCRQSINDTFSDPRHGTVACYDACSPEKTHKDFDYCSNNCPRFYECLVIHVSDTSVTSSTTGKRRTSSTSVTLNIHDDVTQATTSSVQEIATAAAAVDVAETVHWLVSPTTLIVGCVVVALLFILVVIVVIYVNWSRSTSNNRQRSSKATPTDLTHVSNGCVAISADGRERTSNDSGQPLLQNHSPLTNHHSPPECGHRCNNGSCGSACSETHVKKSLLEHADGDDEVMRSPIQAQDDCDRSYRPTTSAADNNHKNDVFKYCQ